MGIPEKIKLIEEEIARTEINKATERHLGVLKARRAKLMRDVEEQAIRASSKRGPDEGYSVKKYRGRYTCPHRSPQRREINDIE